MKNIILYLFVIPLIWIFKYPIDPYENPKKPGREWSQPKANGQEDWEVKPREIKPNIVPLPNTSVPYNERPYERRNK